MIPLIFCLFLCGNVLAQPLDRNPSFEPGVVCTTKLCQSMSDYLFKSVNENVSPCDDFKEYVCSAPTQVNYNDVNKRQAKINDYVLLELTKATPEEPWLRNAQALYKSCMDANNTNLTSLFDSIYKDWQNKSIEKVLGELVRNYSAIVVLHPERFSKDTEIIVIKEAKNVLLSVELLHRRHEKAGREHYMDHLLQLRFLYEDFKDIYDPHYQTTLEELIQFEEDLSLFAVPMIEQDVRFRTTQFTLPEFVGNFSHHNFNLEEYLGTFMSPDDKRIIEVENTLYLSNAIQMLSNERNKMVAKDLAFIQMLRIFETFIFPIQEERGTERRHNSCITKITSEFWPLKLRTEKLATPAEYHVMFNETKQVMLPLFREMIMDSRNLAPLEKEVALEKVDKLHLDADHPEYMLEFNNPRINKLYEHHDQIGTDFVENALVLMRIRGEQIFEEDRVFENGVTQPTAQGFYNQVSMQMSGAWTNTLFPLAPFYDSLPIISYARLAFVMAHELGHIIDPLSWTYTADRALRPMKNWTRSFHDHLEKVVECQGKIYRALPSDYEAEFEHDETRYVRIERFTDVIGAELAIHTYRKLMKNAPLLRGNYVNESLDAILFMSVATSPLFCSRPGPVEHEYTNKVEQYANLLVNEHPPGVQRIRLLPAFSPHFANAFKCPPRREAYCPSFF